MTGGFHVFRRLLQEACRCLWNGQDPALLFSGGTDSLTVLWSLLDIGARPVCYTFHLEGKRHADLVMSERTVAILGLVHVVVTIPRDVARLEEDVRHIVRTFKTARKTHVQCLYPMLHIFPQVAEGQVFTGLNADDWWGSAKSDAINCAKDRTEFDRRRRARLADPTTSGWTFWDSLAKAYGKQLCCPYRDPEVVEFLLSKSWAELNKPCQKQPAVEAFAEEFRRFRCYRKNDNLQCGSGIREWHDVLLSLPGNEKYKDVTALYKAVLVGY